MDYIFIWNAFIGIIAIINPISTAFVFLSITTKSNEAKKKEMAYRAVMISAFILIFFSITGFLIFQLFGITIEAFKIAGGILISQVGFRMLHAKKKTTKEEIEESVKRDDVSIIPLAIPILSGPGAITAMLVWTSNAPGITEKFVLLFVPIFISIITYYLLINAKYLKKALGKTGSNVVARLMGLIVVVMGIQFILNGIIEIFPILT
jgi:multiple antibiotic resistance protein